MPRSATIKTIVALILGAVSGYLVGSWESHPLGQARANALSQFKIPDAATENGTSGTGCADGAAKATLLASMLSATPVQAAGAQPTAKKPNILVIFGDDIGIPQISAYTQGLMGYRTPNIDRIAKEGALFTDSYGQNSCTAGRASFILGQEPFRTGLLTIGMPGDPHGITDWMPTIANGSLRAGLGRRGRGDPIPRGEYLATRTRPGEGQTVLCRLRSVSVSTRQLAQRQRN